jgi:hypothetical protein
MFGTLRGQIGPHTITALARPTRNFDAHGAGADQRSGNRDELLAQLVDFVA